MKTEKGRREIPNLYILEGIACLAVITIHIGFPGTIGVIVNVIARFAVPLFFIVSGFFLQNNSGDINCLLNRKILKILKLSISSIVFYWCWGAVLHCFILQEMTILAWIKSLISFRNIIGLIFMNSVPGGGHLWFLLALLYSYIVLKILNCIDKYKYIVYFPALLIFTILIPDLLQIYCYYTGSTIDLPISMFRNWLFEGLPFVSIGIIINKVYIKLSRLKPNIFICIGIAGVVISLLERIFLRKNMDLYFGTIILVVAAFIYCVIKTGEKLYILGNIGKNMSTTIYIYHYVFVDVMWVILSAMNNNYNKIISCIAPFIVWMLSILFAYTIQNIKKIKIYGIDKEISDKRDPHLDTMKAILIYLVVLGHCLSNLFDIHAQWLIIMIYSFHMPAWFMTSGIVFNTSYSFAEFIKKKIKGLLFPIIKFAIILEIYYCIMNFIQGNLTAYLYDHYSFYKMIRNVMFVYNGSWGGLWYLPSLFIVSVIGYILNNKIINKTRWLCICVLTVLGFILIKYDLHMPFYTEISLIALPFFYLGKPIYNGLKNLNIKQCKLMFFIVSLCWICITFIFSYKNNIVIQMASGRVGNPCLFYLIGILGSISVMTMSLCIKSVPIIQLVGRETLFIYGLHYPVVALFRFIIKRMIHTQNIVLTTSISIILSALIIAFLMCVRFGIKYNIYNRVKKTGK